MSFINRGQNLWGAESTEIRATLSFAAIADFDTAETVFSPSIRESLELSAAALFSAAEHVLTPHLRQTLNFQAAGSFLTDAQRTSQRTLNFRAKAQFSISEKIKLQLIQPDAILNEIAENAFEVQPSGARVKNGSTELPIRNITINAPAGQLGKTVRVELSTKDIGSADKAGNYKVEIQTKTHPADSSPVWHTIIESGELNNRDYQMAWLRDGLSFGVIAPLSDRLNKCPKSNLIVYDPEKVQASISDFETIYDRGGLGIVTNLEAVSVLTLYKLLNTAFVAGCGFSSVQTNVPNFQIARCDFTIKQSWYQSVKGFLGIFETVIFAVGNVLWIIDKTQAIPEDFAPRTISPNEFIEWGQQVNSAAPIDGLILQYVESTNNADTVNTRTISSSIDIVPFSSPDWTHVDTVQTWKDYSNSDKPDVIVRSELYTEVKETVKGAADVIGRDTETYFYDNQGRRNETRKVSQKLVPDLTDYPNKSLLEIRREIQEYFYKSDRFNPGRTVQDRIVTNISGKIAIDSDNKYLEEDFKQDYLEAHKAGNLKDGMTTESGAIKTITESFYQIGAGQLQVLTETVDHVRNLPIAPTSDIRQADTSFSSIGGKQKELIIWKEGQSRDSRDGNPLEVFAVGELPYFFAEPLAVRTLARRDDKPESGTLEILGYDPSIERGVYFGVLDRNGDLVGNFIVEGYSVSGTDLGTRNERWSTRLEVSQVV